VKDVTVSFATTCFMQVCNILTGMLAAQLLLPAGRGELAAIILWPGLIAEMGNLGLHDALLYRAATRSASPRDLFAAIVALIGTLSVVLIAIGLVIVPIVFRQHSPEVQAIALYFLCAYLPIYFSSLFTTGMFQGHLQMTTWNMLRALVPFTYLAGIVLLLAVDVRGVAEFAIAYIAAQAVSAAAGFFMVARRNWVALKPDIKVIRSLIVYGIKVHVGDMVYSLRQRIDQALIALLLPAADLGIYTVALTIANGPLILVFTLANLAFPKISQQPTTAGKLEVFGRYLRFSLAATGGMIITAWILVPWVLPLLFGKPFAPAVPIANLLLLGTLPLAAKLMFQQALKAWDRPLVVGRAELVGLAVAAGLIAGLMPAFGLIGVALALVFSQLSAAAVMGFSLHTELRLPVLKLFVPIAQDWQLTRDWVAAVWRLICAWITTIAMRLTFRNG
jgi:O-antigen/teichoic acid export membrane protein